MGDVCGGGERFELVGLVYPVFAVSRFTAVVCPVALVLVGFLVFELLELVCTLVLEFEHFVVVVRGQTFQGGCGGGRVAGAAVCTV
jgi:hypothetical protein